MLLKTQPISCGVMTPAPWHLAGVRLPGGLARREIQMNQPACNVFLHAHVFTARSRLGRPAAGSRIRTLHTSITYPPATTDGSASAASAPGIPALGHVGLAVQLAGVHTASPGLPDTLNGGFYLESELSVVRPASCANQRATARAPSALLGHWLVLGHHIPLRISTYLPTQKAGGGRFAAEIPLTSITSAWRSKGLPLWNRDVGSHLMAPLPVSGTFSACGHVHVQFKSLRPGMTLASSSFVSRTPFPFNISLVLQGNCCNDASKAMNFRYSRD
ncbi:hypothetical protein SUNI508_06816 [Seiridium unicorne]|uniref:Uncharacterized protein n=1 Tax=Seiridium unicorne TaxID=138068 RepID=A0ABR2UZP1_9PEZI